MKQVVVNRVVVESKKIVYEYTVEGIEEYFSSQRSSYVEYFFLGGVQAFSQELGIIPFVCNILPVIWLTDATLKLETLDKKFYEQIPLIKQGYQNMYPMLDFKGKIEVGELVNAPVIEGEKSACFFSGGVDAYTTLLRHLEEKPILLTVWGSDVKLDDVQGWKNVQADIDTVAHDFNLEKLFIKSDFRDVLNERKLKKLVVESGDDWWHGFQHGISIISLVAPVVTALNLGKVYFASSNFEGMKGRYTCASDPTIDNFVAYANAKTIHDGYELDRQDKVHFLIKKLKEINKNILLRVCWDSTGGKNCSKCEKCYRTILEIVVEGENPNDYGFQWDNDHIEQCRKDMLYLFKIPQMSIEQYYIRIQELMKINQYKIENYDKYVWLVNLDFSKFNKIPLKKLNRSFIMRFFRKLIKVVNGHDKVSVK